MSTTTVASPTYTERVAAAVRAELARANIKQVQVRAALGLSGAAASARYNAVTPWTVEELAQLATLLGVSVNVLLPRLDSNQQPAGYAFVLVSALLSAIARTSIAAAGGAR